MMIHRQGTPTPGKEQQHKLVPNCHCNRADYMWLPGCVRHCNAVVIQKSEEHCRKIDDLTTICAVCQAVGRPNPTCSFTGVA